MRYRAPFSSPAGTARMDTLLLLLFLIAGFGILAWSADIFVAGASSMALRLGTSRMLIGLLVIGIGTSLPEMLVSAAAAVDGMPDLVVGNALGSNIANIGLIVGVTALIAPINLGERVPHRDFTLLLLVVAATAVLLADLRLTRLDGIMLLLAMAAVLVWMAWQARRSDDAELARTVRDVSPEVMTPRRILLSLLLGMILLLASSRLLVWSASELARAIGVSELVIGLSIVALGTSLPELAAGAASARRGEHGLIAGNIIGSSVFNLLAVLGIAAVIAPFALEGSSLIRDYGMMTLFILAFVAIGLGIGRRGLYGRSAGFILLSGYILYQTSLYLTGP
ncbi:calcium/sodium antiporter [Spiribacter sp. 2438]|uniref:calcium/sodium antiporter n=1 Tax=Spiribacter sp. 2438 TaxID=2666185 RepID=UPI0012B05180|nr:calcium/sodium antiporter [Spiribacter sp. 2438]QGM22176.1 calcium/sodium antiporter [Spiribacter sp. 2438]